MNVDFDADATHGQFHDEKFGMGGEPRFDQNSPL